jgi:hypothetical protein
MDNKSLIDECTHQQQKNDKKERETGAIHEVGFSDLTIG